MARTRLEQRATGGLGRVCCFTAGAGAAAEEDVACGWGSEVQMQQAAQRGPDMPPAPHRLPRPSAPPHQPSFLACPARPVRRSVASVPALACPLSERSLSLPANCPPMLTQPAVRLQGKPGVALDKAVPVKHGQHLGLRAAGQQAARRAGWVACTAGLPSWSAMFAAADTADNASPSSTELLSLASEGHPAGCCRLRSSVAHVLAMQQSIQVRGAELQGRMLQARMQAQTFAQRPAGSPPCISGSSRAGRLGWDRQTR